MAARTVLCRRVRGRGAVVCLCPFCGKEHEHGMSGEVGPDLGVRIAHCQKSDVPDVNGYRLVLEYPNT